LDNQTINYNPLFFQCAIFNCLPIVSRCTIIQIYHNLISTIWSKGKFPAIVYSSFRNLFIVFKNDSSFQNLRPINNFSTKQKSNKNWNFYVLNFLFYASSYKKHIFFIITSTSIFIVLFRH